MYVVCCVAVDVLIAMLQALRRARLCLWATTHDELVIAARSINAIKWRTRACDLESEREIGLGGESARAERLFSDCVEIG